jgi:hypothetical protein
MHFKVGFHSATIFSKFVHLKDLNCEAHLAVLAAGLHALNFP